MWLRLKRTGTWLGPAFALGLFSSRVLSESWLAIAGHSVGLPVAATLTLSTIVLSALLLHSQRLRCTWPALLLLLYVFYPEPDLRVALGAAALALITTWQVVSWDISESARWQMVTGKWQGAKAGLLLAVAFLMLYVATIAPDMLPADSGELQLVAANLGVAHPPGFPLYTILGHMMTWLPFIASPAYKVNLLSPVLSALTLVLVYLSVYRLGKNQLAAATAVIALGSSTTFWAQATTANVRSMTALFAALGIFALIRFWEAIGNWRLEIGDWGLDPSTSPFLRGLRTKLRAGSSTTQGFGRARIGHLAAPGHRVGLWLQDYYLVLFALALGFGLTHHLSLAFMGLVFGVFVLVVDPTLVKRPQRWLWPVLASLLGLLPLLYLPLRAGADVRGARPGLASVSGFLNHSLALGFQGDFFYFIEPATLWQRVKVMGNVMTFQFSAWLLLGMGIGLVLLVWRERQLAMLLGGSFAVHTFITATYRAPQTVEYMLPAYVPAVICLGYGVSKVLKQPDGNLQSCQLPAYQKGGSSGSMGQIRSKSGNLLLASGQVFAAMMLVAAVGQGFHHYASYAYLSQDTAARDYAQPLLEQAPDGATVLADWHWATPLWYLQEIEGRRPDVRVKFVAPGGEPYAETWAQLIAEEYASGHPVIATHFDEFAYADLPVPEPLGEAFLFRVEPRTTLPEAYIPLDLTLGDQIQILGYQLEPAVVEIGHETTLTLAWQPVSDPNSFDFPLPSRTQDQAQGKLFEDSGLRQDRSFLRGLRTFAQSLRRVRRDDGSPISFFAHLTDASGYLYAQDDPHVRPQPEGITLTRFRLTPRLGTTPGNFDVVVGIVLPTGAARAPIARVAIAPMSWRPVTQNPVWRTVASRPLWRLTGYDWDSTLPGRKRLYLHWETEQGYWTEVRDNEAALAPALPAWFGPWGVASKQCATEGCQCATEGCRCATEGCRCATEGCQKWQSHYVPLGQGIVWTGETISDLPSLISGSTLSLPQHFISSRPVTRDLVVSVRLIGYEDDGTHWAWWDLDDSIPAMGAIPTLKWVNGSRVNSPHVVTVDPAAQAGQAVGAALRLYDAFTNRPLPILDEGITADFSWVPLGQTTIGEP